MSVAPPSASTGLAVTESLLQPEAKKARKNPQRRKTEQTKRQIDPAGQNTADVKATHRPSLKRSQTGPATSTPPTQVPVPTDGKGLNKAKSGRIPAQSSAVKEQSSRDDIKAIAFAPAAIITGGLLGCAASAALLAGVGIWHEYNGTESAILAARTAKLCLDCVADDVTTSLKAGTYSTDEALDVLRRTTLSYASTVPGGVAYVERLFREISLVRQSRGGDVDKVLRSVHGELNSAAVNGATPDAMRTIVISQLARLSTVAGASVQDFMDRNPALKPLQGSPTPKVPTLNVNLTLKSKSAKG
ncbi:hypothetical protein LTR12_008312 [Friedmanniomyces endolithicus]|uniref:Uncharacterized protein n=1 Tax=Friedmanniomyces endolithicus TaxID=329885 RepID=A0A4U0V714_9PEZI|nr:hypothetical protein LTS09_013684 [Friedmanniomyces endolithicus]KAK1817330.1 hypothetical protein LTR12_008312 [Friedmanniomyces endolithicus]TKA44588.1 hypothetical protein B0A54_04538 [Friedmanniomyces endolithicus]